MMEFKCLKYLFIIYGIIYPRTSKNDSWKCSLADEISSLGVEVIVMMIRTVGVAGRIGQQNTVLQR